MGNACRNQKGKVTVGVPSGEELDLNQSEWECLERRKVLVTRGGRVISRGG